jgi:hypothetical protein
MRLFKSLCFVTLASLAWSSCPPPFASAQVASSTDSSWVSDANFDPNNVLDDTDLFDISSWQLPQIQQFLDHHGTLAHYRTKDVDGIEKNAAEIIWRVSSSYGFNAKYLLALMQKEQSLVDDPSPTQKQLDWATGYAICDSCSMTDPAVQKYKGFANQLEWSAKQQREKYLLRILTQGSTIAGRAPGKTCLIDGIAVTPANNATAMLYTYTPHLHGNLNLWRIWQRWFSLLFPEGTIVRGKSSNTVYLLRNGEKRPFQSMAVASSLTDPGKIVLVDDTRLASYTLGKSIKFANYALVEISPKKRYLLVNNERRFIQNKTVFQKFGFNEDEVIEADPSDLDGYTDGEDITSHTTYPTGLLVKDPGGHYWYVENNERQLIPDKAFLALYFKNRFAKNWSSAKLASFTIRNPYRLQDGELVRETTGATVYVIQEGKRRPFQNENDFLELGYTWNNVISLPTRVLAIYSVGDLVSPHAPPIQPSVLVTAPTSTILAQP